MAKYQSIVKITGKVGDMQFSKRDGASRINLAARVKDDPFKGHPRMKENAQEFSGAATAAKALRKSLEKVYRIFADKKAGRRLFSLMKGILNLGAGNRGERIVDFPTNGHNLKDLELNDVDKFVNIFRGEYTTVVNADRNEIQVTIEDFHTVDDVSAPDFGTHLRFILAAGSLSNQNYVPSDDKYKSTNPSQDGINTLEESAPIAVGAMVGSNLVITAQLPGAPVLDPDVSLVAALGIQFLDFVNGQYYVLDSKNAMKIIEVA
jgi:hypothetical protein